MAAPERTLYIGLLFFLTTILSPGLGVGIIIFILSSLTAAGLYSVLKQLFHHYETSFESRFQTYMIIVFFLIVVSFVSPSTRLPHILPEMGGRPLVISLLGLTSGIVLIIFRVANIPQEHSELSRPASNSDDESKDVSEKVDDYMENEADEANLDSSANPSTQTQSHAE